MYARISLLRGSWLGVHGCHPVLRLLVSLQGTMNGLVAMLGAMAGMVAPVVGSEVFAWSIRPEVALPFLTYWGLAVLCLCPIAVSYIIPAHLSEGPPA